jgi:hypothetical protein
MWYHWLFVHTLQRVSLPLPVGMHVLTIFENVPELAGQLIVILLSTFKHILVISHVTLVQTVFILLPVVIIVMLLPPLVMEAQEL